MVGCLTTVYGPPPSRRWEVGGAVLSGFRPFARSTNAPNVERSAHGRGPREAVETRGPTVPGRRLVPRVISPAPPASPAYRRLCSRARSRSKERRFRWEGCPTLRVGYRVVADDLDSVYQLAYDEAKRALTDQASALDALRGRAGTLLAVASLATAFLGGLVFENGTPKGWAPRLGMFAFIGVVLLSLLLLVPLPGWRFTASPKAIVRDFIEAGSPASLTETHRELALRFGKWLDRNQKRLNVLYLIFAAASALLAVEVGAWLFALTKGK
jgi:hypothetical protein